MAEVSSVREQFQTRVARLVELHRAQRSGASRESLIDRSTWIAGLRQELASRPHPGLTVVSSAEQLANAGEVFTIHVNGHKVLVHGDDSRRERHKPGLQRRIEQDRWLAEQARVRAMELEVANEIADFCGDAAYYEAAEIVGEPATHVANIIDSALSTKAEYPSKRIVTWQPVFAVGNVVISHKFRMVEGQVATVETVEWEPPSLRVAHAISLRPDSVPLDRSLPADLAISVVELDPLLHTDPRIVLASLKKWTSYKSVVAEQQKPLVGRLLDSFGLK